MNLFILTSITFIIILIYRIISVVQKSFWKSAIVLISETDREIDANGCITVNINFEYDDRMLHRGTLSITEQFSNLSSSFKNVDLWLERRGIHVGERIEVFYNPKNPLQYSFYNNFTSKDKRQIILWINAAGISLIVAFLISRPI